MYFLMWLIETFKLCVWLIFLPVSYFCRTALAQSVQSRPRTFPELVFCSLLFSFTPVQPHWLACCLFEHRSKPGILLPQDLCTCCFHSQRTFPPVTWIICCLIFSGLYSNFTFSTKLILTALLKTEFFTHLHSCIHRTLFLIYFSP